jgi:hypothetical protein
MLATQLTIRIQKYKNNTEALKIRLGDSYRALP